jgi:tetratricopeptide (TPR) repeat protein
MMRQKRQRAFEAAFTVGMSGNLAAAENALKETEMTGVSVGEVRILRGLVEFQNGNLDKSIEELRQALKLLPQSIPARSLLAEAYNHSWRYSEYLEQAEQLEKIVPVTAEDHLFKGWAFANADAPSALQLLDQAIAMHDTPIARALRAEVRTMISFDGGTVKQAEQLLLDAAVALENLPNHPYVLYATLWSSVAAADIYGKAGDVRRRAEILEQASQYAKTLLPFVSLPDPAFGLWCYWNYLGDTKKILELMEPLAEQKRSPAFAYLCAVPLLGRGNPTKANDLLEPFAEVKNSGYDVLRALIAAERSGRSEAMQVYQTARTRHKNRSDLGLLLSIPFMLGESARGRADAREIRRTAPPLPRFQMQFDDQILRYYAGEISADELLGLAAAQKWKKGVFFAIGASSLGEKNRAKAKEYFQKVLETPAFGASVFDFAWVMTQRLESDPKWPAWAQ